MATMFTLPKGSYIEVTYRRYKNMTPENTITLNSDNHYNFESSYVTTREFEPSWYIVKYDPPIYNERVQGWVTRWRFRKDDVKVLF